VTDVVPNLTAWQSPAPADAPGVLVLHGFTGNPTSMRPLAEAMAAEGWAVELPLLPGHGTTWQEMNRTTWHDWAREAAAALHRLRHPEGGGPGAVTRPVAIAALSMGATLALHLAETRAADIAGLALVNPAVFMRNPAVKLVPLLRWVLPSTAAIGNDIAKEGVSEHAYPRVPLHALGSMLALQRSVRADLGAVRAPLLVFTSRQDHVVEPENSAAVLAGVSSDDTEQVWLERSYHVATLDHDADLIVERTKDFVRRVTAT
jgi:carboxylesterase